MTSIHQADFKMFKKENLDLRQNNIFKESSSILFDLVCSLGCQLSNLTLPWYPLIVPKPQPTGQLEHKNCFPTTSFQSKHDQGVLLKGQEAGTSLWNITDALKILRHPPSQLTATPERVQASWHSPLNLRPPCLSSPEGDF